MVRLQPKRALQYNPSLQTRESAPVYKKNVDRKVVVATWYLKVAPIGRGSRSPFMDPKYIAPATTVRRKQHWTHHFTANN
eukprot:Em0015g239a